MLRAKKDEYEAKRQAEENPNLERIYLGMRDAFEISALLAEKAASARTLGEDEWCERCGYPCKCAAPAVAQPQAAEPKGLTEEQIEKAALDFVKKPGMQGYVEPGDLIDFARALLANGE